MPLHKGKSQATVSKNITELLNKYVSSGSIGTSHPANKKKAQKQAVAISLKKSRESK